MTDTIELFGSTQLLEAVAVQQRRVQGILDGLDDESLRRPVPPTGWSCLGMVQHLTGMTRFWFVEVMAGRLGENPVGDSYVVADARSAEEVLDDFRTGTETANAAIRQLPSTTQPAWWPDGLFGDWRLDSLADVLTHVLVETSCHTGHLDAARELIDGRTWDWERGRLA
jgi:uncharacterized damage-inducible protein DinB